MADPRGYTEHIKLLDGEVWTVEVGQLKQTWKVHQGLLCNRSTFFQSAVKQEWNYGETKTIVLLEDDADVFEIYVQWLYQDKLLVQNRKQCLHESGTLDKLIRCYIFGEKIQDTVFQNTIIDGIFAHVHDKDEDGRSWYPSDADTVYKGTPEGSPLRMLIVDMFVYHGGQDWIKSQRNVDFFVDLTKKLLDLRGRPSGVSPLSRETSSVYHKPVPTAVIRDLKLERDC